MAAELFKPLQLNTTRQPIMSFFSERPFTNWRLLDLDAWFSCPSNYFIFEYPSKNCKDPKRA